jgi:LuxR family transcriptional regulator, maltose regulon positive regulatory protein
VQALATPVVAWLAATQARLGMLDEARELLIGFPAEPDRTGTGFISNARAVIGIAEGDPAGALEVLRDLPDVEPGPAFTLAESHLLTGIAHLHLGDRNAAAAAAEVALAAAEPDRLIFPFAMTGAGELLEVLPRHQTAHGALLADIVDVLRGDHGSARAYRPVRLPHHGGRDQGRRDCTHRPARGWVRAASSGRSRRSA